MVSFPLDNNPKVYIIYSYSAVLELVIIIIIIVIVREREVLKVKHQSWI